MVPRYLDVPVGSHYFYSCHFFQNNYLTIQNFMTKIESISSFLFNFFFSIREKKFSTLQTFSISSNKISQKIKLKKVNEKELKKILTLWEDQEIKMWENNFFYKSKWKKIEENFNFTRGPRNQGVFSSLSSNWWFSRHLLIYQSPS